MRTLALETSTIRGSVALLDGERVLAVAEHHTPSAHAELLLPLVDRVLRDSGLGRDGLERIAVGTGPGSFVGLRVGIALAEGIALGLGLDLVGVPSLHAMTRAVPRENTGPRIAMVDARRAEVFLCVTDAAGAELTEITAVPRDALKDALAAIGPDAVVVGEVAADLALPWPNLRGPELDLPHARWIAAIGSELDPKSSPAKPRYVRGAGATLPNLPPSPLDAPPSSDGVSTPR